MEQEDLSSYREAKCRGIKAALRLLERKPDEAYLSNWTEVLAQPKTPLEKRGMTVIIFRLNMEWLAISSTVFCEVIHYKKIHRIPHRTNAILMGLVNYQGMLKLCVNMHNFLTIESEKTVQPLCSKKKFPRMVSIEKEQEQWIFPVDEVHGIFHLDSNHLQNVPVTVKKSKASYLGGMIEWNDISVGYIDEEQLFFGLKRSVL